MKVNKGKTPNITVEMGDMTSEAWKTLLNSLNVNSEDHQFIGSVTFNWGSFRINAKN